VVLASAKAPPELPWTLANLHWVDFRVTDLDPVEQLIWGITGEKPREQSHVSIPNNPVVPGEDFKELLPRKDKMVIELRLPGNLNEFSDKERDRILAGLYALLEVGEVRVTRAMAGSIRLHLELKPEDADKIYAATQNGQLAALGISEARLYPAIAITPEGEQRSQLLILLDRVKETWVDGVLKNSIYNEALIALGKRPIEEAVEPPRKHFVELSNQRSQLLLQDRNIITIFDATGLLLILGEPGSGKTTTLLELATKLITRAKADAKERVPFVLNLSSWKKKQSLAEWIAVELSEKYRVPVKIARSWLENDYLVPLLDGLDEVPIALQPDCVAAINDYIDGSETSGLVVCCRLNEYRWLPRRLKLNGAICLESLSSKEVSNYLAKGGSKLAALREAVDTDPVLQELAQTPLILSIMSLACQGADGNELARQKGDSPEERRKQIFGLYVEQMFQRKGMASLAFPKEKVIVWLSWLARKMGEHSQSVFLVETLKPSWLGARAKRIAYGTVVALSLGLIFGLIFGQSYTLIEWLMGGESWLMDQGLFGGVFYVLHYWESSGLAFWVACGLIFGLIFGLLGGVIGGLIGGLTRGLLGSLLGGLTCGTIAGLTYGLFAPLLHWVHLPASIIAVIFGVSILLSILLGCWSESPLKNGVISGLMGGLIFGTSCGMSSSLVGGLIGGLLVGLIGGLGAGSLNHITLVETVSWKWDQFWKRTIPGSIIGLIFGMIVELIIGLRNGRFKDNGFIALLLGFFWGLVFGLLGGLISGLVGGFTDRVKVGKASPNQGVKLSRNNSLAALLVTWLTSGLIVGLYYWCFLGYRDQANWQISGLTAGLAAGLISGLIFGLIVGLNRGGSAAIKHYALRLTLWLSGYTPFNFVKFLDQCAKLILLKKVGGGYIFIHRMVLEYFAEMAPSRSEKQD
jgi:eukaryotic-like serine/threonine-protein kinase